MDRQEKTHYGWGERMTIEVGLIGELEYTVGEQDAASHFNPDLPSVLATPQLVSMLERTAHETIQPQLPSEQTSVGTLVNIRHLAATPVGMKVRTRAELLEVNRRRLLFRVEAWDEVEKIAEGEHERAIIDRSRFEQRLEEKRKALG